MNTTTVVSFTVHERQAATEVPIDMNTRKYFVLASGGGVQARTLVKRLLGATLTSERTV